MTLMITDAIQSAETKHTVYFLLTAYVETLALAESIPENVKRLPIRGRADVCRRTEVMHTVLRRRVRDRRMVLKIAEATQLFDLASEQLEKL
jgi:hypothetical protein